MSQHTPGKWTYSRINIGHPDNAKNPIVSSPSNYIARLFSSESTLMGMTSRGPSLEEAEANARLIAAAPELLAALEDLVNDSPYACDSDLCECGEFDTHSECCHTRAHSALKKAKGQS